MRFSLHGTLEDNEPPYFGEKSAKPPTFLKTLGLKWNAMKRRWEGYGDAEEIRHFLEPHGGMVGEGP